MLPTLLPKVDCISKYDFTWKLLLTRKQSNDKAFFVFGNLKAFSKYPGYKILRTCIFYIITFRTKTLSVNFTNILHTRFLYESLEKAINIEYGIIDFENVNFETAISTRF